MSTMFACIPMDGLRKAHLRQLLSYITERDESGWYVGDKEQFEKRHAEIKWWIEDAVEYAYSEGVVMPGDRRKK